MVRICEKCLHVHSESCEKNYDWLKQTPREKTSLVKFSLEIITTMDYVRTPCIIGVDFMLLASAVHKLDNAIHWISHYPQNNTTGFSSTYLPDSDLSCG